MRKKISMLALAGALVIPGAALAQELSLEEKVEALTREVEELKAHTAEIDDTLWHDMSTRFHLSGDFRSRYDYYSRDRYVGTNYVDTGSGVMMPTDIKKVTEKNSSLMTNRLRLNMYARAQENVEFVGRLAMFKAWGMQSTPDNTGDFPAIDGNSSRRPEDNKLLVDRAIINWNNIADTNFWFSIGRRPTTDGPPSQLRMNSETRLATPLSYMDWPFDGLTIGYAYDSLFNVIDLPGRVRFCFGRGFEAGLGENTLKDTDFMGISWDIYNNNDRFVYFQSYVAKDVFNFPDMDQAIVDQMNQDMAYSALAMAQSYGLTPAQYGPIFEGMTPMERDNIGDIYHTAALYKDRAQNFHYFVAGGWSRTDPNSNGMFNDNAAGMQDLQAALAMTAGLNPGDPGYVPFANYSPNTSSENGYSIYLGARYDLPNTQFKFGLEYNYGSEYWIGMSPGHDDIYASKLATRGHVYEVYGIYDIPGRAVSSFGNAFIRVGYQHYDYNYTGSLDWNTKPYDLSSSSERAMATYMGIETVDKADQVYVTFEARF
ncbi:DUF3373 family protein [Desulfurivibrio dismutans]|uniref:DUF3373 family protein n=1 Tax=Desulfurivibrio dismutans TaxID=1398908 RepID=UPI0023DBBAEC|nr:DUF3373 family protein [Desulfurivibrio alkaliphilus]MDF1613899.1 DUF3373 family protein [Desulfurivibrio alkaliphilus]